MPEKLLDVQELSELLHVPAGTLYQWRHRGFGPPALKLTPSKLRYRLTDVEKWLDRCAVDGGPGGRPAA